MTEIHDASSEMHEKKFSESNQQAGVVADQPLQAIVSNEAPDAGLTAWSVVVGGWCAMFVSVGWNNAAGVFQTIYETDRLQHYSPGTIGWIISLQTFFMFICAPITGKVFDSYGPRWIIVIGSVLQILGVMMMSLFDAVLALHPFTVYLHWHRRWCNLLRRLKFHCNLVQAQQSSSFGHSFLWISYGWSHYPVGPTLLLYLATCLDVYRIMVNHVYHNIGFGWALRVVGFVFIGLLAVTNVLLKSRLLHVAKKPHPMDFLQPLQEPPFLFLTAACFFFALAVYQPGTFIALNAQRQGVHSNVTNYLMSMLNASSVIGRVVSGWVADRAGRFNTMIITTFLSSLFVLAAWIPAKSTAPFIVFAVLVGFTNGAYVALTSSLVAQISDIKKIGTRNGTNWFMYGVGALIGTPIAGALIQRDDGGYLYMQIFAGLAMFISGCLFVGSRYVQIGFAWKWI